MAIASRFRHSLVIGPWTIGATTDGRGHRNDTFVAQTAILGNLQETESHEVVAPEFGGAAISNAKAWLPIGTVLTARDRITFGSKTYEVLGTPRDAGGRGRHLEVDLRTVKS
jgi:hypothetical protein